ncbi:hypothetical protein IQ273_18685 [Nodosilinea sp. LEGE 07298]|uniref:hypothetical protein n=1 Tax=Nodosilinea sp. LEGE 07298 TaxID=2777970 RepID=UPI00187E8457|nr:hypothetical protein [Nodosilinea sp. LEGE 07298]MBE9111435.1 hypothetical protein [Nodosilinea sp. LEGE 07298]
MPLRSSFRSQAPNSNAPGAVQVWVGARPRRLGRWLGVLLALASLGGGLALLGLSFRLGLRLMLDPTALPQVLARLQRSQQVALPPATSLEDLRQQALAAQQRLGELLPLGTSEADDSRTLLVPVLEADSEAIVSLTLLQGTGRDDELSAIASLTIPPLSKDLVLAPWLNNSQAPTAAPSSFTFNQVVTLPAPPVATDGVWLTLAGTWQQQGLTLRYGHLVHYDPQNQRLELLKPWSSPTNRPPQWADLDGDGPSDLVIDETIGLEPALQGWQVIAGDTPRLQTVSWVRVPGNAGAQASAYQQALRLARSGLWSLAATSLTDLKAALAEGWTPAAEAQLRLAERHAAITQQQANQDWSTPTQQVMALLIDGRWEAALTQVEANPDLLPTLINRLATDRGRMWNRISAAAARPAPEPAVYVWGGLALKAQQNQPTSLDGATQDWLTRQPVPAATRQRLNRMLIALASSQSQTSASARASEKNSATNQEAIAPAQTTGTGAIAIAPLEVIIGEARPIPAPQAGYAAPGQTLDPSLGQWYAVELRAAQQNQTWQQSSLSVSSEVTPAALWPVVQPAAQAAPQVLRWVTPTTGIPAPLTIRGLRLTDGIPTLLATGPTVTTSALPPLVFSQGALTWLDASQRQRPDAQAILTPVGAALFGNQPLPTELAGTLTNLAQHSLDLTGNGQPERVLTWSEAAQAQLAQWQVPVDQSFPKTVIVTSSNQVIYNDLFNPQTVVALTNPTLGGPMGLLVHRAEGYTLLIWNATSNRFE